MTEIYNRNPAHQTYLHPSPEPQTWSEAQSLHTKPTEKPKVYTPNLQKSAKPTPQTWCEADRAPHLLDRACMFPICLYHADLQNQCLDLRFLCRANNQDLIFLNCVTRKPSPGSGLDCLICTNSLESVLPGSFLTRSAFKVVLQKSTSPRIRQLILFYYLYKDQVEEFVWESTFAKRPPKHIV